MALHRANVETSQVLTTLRQCRTLCILVEELDGESILATKIPWLSFMDEESAPFMAEIYLLQAFSLVCKIAGSKPSRGELHDMLQGQLLADIGKMVDILTLGMGYYQIEFVTGQRW